MRLGQTITAKREKTQTESERLLVHEKQKKRKMMNVVTLGVLLLAVALFLGVVVANLIEGSRKPQAQNEAKIEPTIQIVDESGTKTLTGRMKTYIGQLEQDLKDERQIPLKAVVPNEKMREIDIYLQGRKEYYKCNLDRGTAETAEDIARMRQFLEKHKIEPEYVDVRIEQQAYYR